MKSDRRPVLSRRGKSSWIGTFNTSARNMRSLSSTKRSKLEFYGESGLGPAECVPPAVHLRPMLLWNRIARPSRLSGFAFGGLEAGAGSAGALAELDQPVCVGFREQRGRFFTKLLDRPVARSGDEEAGENAAGEILDLFYDFPFLIDLRLERRPGEVDADNAADQRTGPGASGETCGIDLPELSSTPSGRDGSHAASVRWRRARAVFPSSGVDASRWFWSTRATAARFPSWCCSPRRAAIPRPRAR